MAVSVAEKMTAAVGQLADAFAKVGRAFAEGLTPAIERMNAVFAKMAREDGRCIRCWFVICGHGPGEPRACLLTDAPDVQL